MGLKEEWQQLPGRTKMMIIGGGGLAIFFLYTAIRNRNAVQSQDASQQDTSVGPQTAAIDPSSMIDSSTQMQQMIGGISDSLSQYSQTNQQDMQALQDLVKQNQQSTIQQIQSITNQMSANPIYKPVPTPTTNPVTKPTPAPAPKPAPAPVPKPVPKPAPAPVPKPAPKSVTKPVSAAQQLINHVDSTTGYKGNSLVDYLKSAQSGSDMYARTKIANTLGIKNYTGTAAQNTTILNKLRSDGK